MPSKHINFKSARRTDLLWSTAHDIFLSWTFEPLASFSYSILLHQLPQLSIAFPARQKPDPIYSFLCLDTSPDENTSASQALQRLIVGLYVHHPCVSELHPQYLDDGRACLVRLIDTLVLLSSTVYELGQYE